MSVWDVYENRMAARGETRRETVLRREKRTLKQKLPNSLSYHTVTMYDQAHGYNIKSDEMKEYSIIQNVGIINSDNLNEKYIYSLPDEDFEHGSLVEWMDNYWLITELDANNTVYRRAKMVQCNYLLKWVTADNKIIEQWCIVEDGTKSTRIMRNGLVCWKRHAKRIPLIAGTPLELYLRNGAANSRTRHGLKSIQIGQSAAKPRAGEGSTTIPDVGVGASAPKWGTLTCVLYAVW